MSPRGSPPFGNKSFLKLPHPFSLFSPLSFSLSVSLRLIPRNQLGAFCGRYQYFSWEKCRVSSRETRGDGTPGCAEGDILPEDLLDIDSIHFHIFPHFLPLCSLIFNLSLAPFIAFFVSPTSYQGVRRRINSRK